MILDKALDRFRPILDAVGGVLVPIYFMFSFPLFIYSAYNFFSSGFHTAWLAATISTFTTFVYMITLYAFLGKTKKARLDRRAMFLFFVPLALLLVTIVDVIGTSLWAPVFVVTFSTVLGAFYSLIYVGFASHETTKLRQGSKFPEGLKLMTHEEKYINLDDVVSKSPCLFLFYRGAWCPVCFAQISEIAERYQELKRRGIQTFLISPQPFAKTKEIAEAQGIDFIYGVDEKLELINMLDLRHKAGVPILAFLFAKHKHDTVYPTVLITDEMRRIVYLDQTDNYRVRPEPAVFLDIFDRHQIAFDLEKEVNKKVTEIRGIYDYLNNVYDNVELGIFSLQSELKISSKYTAYLEDLLGFKIDENTRFPDVAASWEWPEEDRDTVLGFLDTIIGGDSLNYEMNADSLPLELKTKKGRTIQLSWSPLLGSDDLLRELIVTIDDVTEKRELEARMEQEIFETKILMAVVRADRGQLESYLGSSLELLNLVSSMQSSELSSQHKRDLHTIKGSSRSLGFSHISAGIHDVEEALTGENTKMQDHVFPVIENIKLIEGAYEKYVKGKSSTGDREALERTLEIMSQLDDSPLLQQAKDLLAGSLYMTIGDIIRGLEELCADTAKHLDKMPPNIVMDEICQETICKNPFSQALRDSAVHLLNNAIDHGIEDQKTREAIGKPKTGEINLSCEKTADGLSLRISDDGGGINLAAIRSKAEKNGIDVNGADDLKLADLLFAPEFSTAKSTSVVSGRGVGLDAVRSELKRFDCNIMVEKKEGPAKDGYMNFCFKLDIPKHLLFNF